MFKVIDLNGCIYDTYGTFVDEDRDVQFILCDDNGEFYVTNVTNCFYKLYKEDLEGHVRAQESFCEEVNCKAKKTNADKIRSMTDEELAAFLTSNWFDKVCENCEEKYSKCGDLKFCEIKILEWIKE